MKRRRMTPLFSPITGEVRDEESEGGDGWDWATDFDPKRTDVGGVEASFDGMFGTLYKDRKRCRFAVCVSDSWVMRWVPCRVMRTSHGSGPPPRD